MFNIHFSDFKLHSSIPIGHIVGRYSLDINIIYVFY
jgi:hypothetical protein